MDSRRAARVCPYRVDGAGDRQTLDSMTTMPAWRLLPIPLHERFGG